MMVAQIDDASRFKGEIHNYNALRISIEDDFYFPFNFSSFFISATLIKLIPQHFLYFLLLFIERHSI